MITRDTHPDHDIVGWRYRGCDTADPEWKSITYYCESYEPGLGYWMQALEGSKRITNVSERAINRTFKRIYEEADGTEWTTHGYINKPKMGRIV